MRVALALSIILVCAAPGCGGETPAARDAALDRTTADTAAPDVTPDVAPRPDAPASIDATADVALPPPVCEPLVVEPASVRIGTRRGAYFRARGGSNRGALFTLAPGAMTGGATLTPGGGLLAGGQSASFEVVASDLMCNLSVRARVEVVGPFVVEPTVVRIAPGRTLRFTATGALAAVRWEILQRPMSGSTAGDGSLDAMGVFNSGAVAGVYRLRARDTGGDSEVQATVTVASGNTFAPAAPTLLVPRGRRVRLDWRGGSGYVDASITAGSAGGSVTGTVGATYFDAATARAGSATVSATDRYTNERTAVRVLVGEEIAPPPVARGPLTFFGDVGLGDVNGDGRADMVLGQANRSETGSETGAAVVFHGQEGGTFRDAPDLVINGERDNDLFAANVLVTDLNNDRIDDLVVASFNQDLGRDGRGSVQMFLGSRAGLVTPPERTFVGEAAADQFGTSVVVDDLDRDGARDLIVAAPGAANPFITACGRAGRVYVYRGVAGVRGLFQTVPWQVIEVRDRLDDLDGAPQCRTGTAAGSGMALLDLDGDGARDLCLGAPGSGAPNFGSVIVYRGTTRGTFEDAPSWTIHLAAALRANNPRFGFGLDVVPVSATEQCLVVRVPTFGQNAVGASTVNAGGLFVFRRGSLGERPTMGQVRVLTTAAASARFTGSAVNENVGRSGAVGDSDGDGDADYLVGATAPSLDGAVHVFEASALASLGALTPSATLRTEMAALDGFGQRVAIGRAPTGTTAPLVVMASSRSTSAAVFGGALRWFAPGAPRTFTERVMTATWKDIPVLPTSDRTGTSVALGALRGGSSAGDLALGSPGAHSVAVPMVGMTAARPAGFRSRTGAVDVFGATGASAQRFWLDATNAQIGNTVATLDFDGDGRMDIAVGSPTESAGGTDMIARASPPLVNVNTDPCWLRVGAAVQTASPGGRGVVRIYLQGTDGAFRERFWAIARETIATGGTPRRRNFGTSLAAAGDVNGDAIPDLIVGHNGAADGNGAEVILGRAADTSGRITAVCTDPAAAPYWDFRTDSVVFGVVVAGVGDLDDDGCAETAVSLSGSGRAGVSLQYGFGPMCRRMHTARHEVLIVADDRPLRANETPDGGVPRATTLRSSDWVDLPGAATGMGLVIAGGADLNGDRVPDLAVRDANLLWRDRVGPVVEILSGAFLNGLCPDHRCTEGLAGGFYSDGAGYNVVGVRTLDPPQRIIIPAYNPTSIRFGAALAVSDLDGDGVSELLVGASDDATYGPFSGAAIAWRASADQESFLGAPALIAVGDVAEASLFGNALAVSRDAGGAWVAVGAPFSSHRGAQTGAAYRWRIDR